MAARQGQESGNFVHDCNVGQHNYHLFARFLDETPSPSDSDEFDGYCAKLADEAFCERIKAMVLPIRHDGVDPSHDGKWGEVFKSCLKILTTRPDAMFALLGPRGTGKTQMAVELVKSFVSNSAHEASSDAIQHRRIIERRGGGLLLSCSAIYTTAMEFFMDLKSSYAPESGQTEDLVLNKYVTPELLVVDEVHDRSGSQWEDRLFTHMIDRRYRMGGKKTIFISNQTPKEFEADVGASISDRIDECGGIVRCEWESFRHDAPPSKGKKEEEPSQKNRAARHPALG